jgi:hypothetical protein
MDEAPDHRSETARSNRWKSSVLSVMVGRSRKIIERLGAGILQREDGEIGNFTVHGPCLIEVIRGKSAGGQARFCLWRGFVGFFWGGRQDGDFVRG